MLVNMLNQTRSWPVLVSCWKLELGPKHDGFMIEKCFPHYWPFLSGLQWIPLLLSQHTGFTHNWTGHVSLVATTGTIILAWCQVTAQGSHTGQHKKFPEFSLSFPWDIWKFQSYFEPFIQISKGNSLPKEVSWRNIHEKFCYSNESYGLLTPLTASLSSTFWLTASFKCSLHIYQVIHKWLFDCNLKNRGLHWMTTMFCMSPMLKWTWA